MSGAGEDKDRWVSRVLGIDLAAANTKGEPAEPTDIVAVWREAKEAADVQINALAARLRRTGDPDLVRIADFGLFGISSGKGVSVALTRALMEYRMAAPDRRAGAAQQVRKAVGTYRGALAGEGVRLIDRNPFGVNVGLAARLGAALDRIERALA